MNQTNKSRNKILNSSIASLSVFKGYNEEKNN